MYVDICRILVNVSNRTLTDVVEHCRCWDSGDRGRVR